MSIVASKTDSVRTTPATWQTILKSAIRDSGELLRQLGLDDSELAGLVCQSDFPTFVTTPWLQRIKPGDPNDPLLLQVLPQAAEALSPEGFGKDAVGDQAATKANGLLHKYHGRALLIASGTCAVHCRYCFRRHYPYSEAPVSIKEFDRVLQVVREDQGISEMILSGGDPLMMVDRRLADLIGLIEDIPHVRRLRIHTRLPILIPQRVTECFLAMLTQSRLTHVVVLHINHPKEIDADVREAVLKIANAGGLLLNQSVLLKGVNDCLDTLLELSEKLIELRCQPYYLHQLDRVQGVAHFEVTEEVGRHLIQQMRHRLPGYAVPRYVREIPGEPSKTIIL